MLLARTITESMVDNNKKKKRKPRRHGRSLQLYLDPTLWSRLASYVRTSKPKTTKTAVVEQALTEYLNRKGGGREA